MLFRSQMLHQPSSGAELVWESNGIPLHILRENGVGGGAWGVAIQSAAQKKVSTISTPNIFVSFFEVADGSTILMALGQIMSVNSYQIVLLTGESSQTSTQLYIIGSVYLVASIVYWFMIRNLKSLYAITLPWLFFGLAFMLLGVAPFLGNGTTQGVVRTTATAFYAAGASSGAVMFALNFGDEGKAILLP